MLINNAQLLILLFCSLQSTFCKGSQAGKHMKLCIHSESTKRYFLGHFLKFWGNFLRHFAKDLRQANTWYCAYSESTKGYFLKFLGHFLWHFAKDLRQANTWNFREYKVIREDPAKPTVGGMNWNPSLTHFFRSCDLTIVESIQLLLHLSQSSLSRDLEQATVCEVSCFYPVCMEYSTKNIFEIWQNHSKSEFSAQRMSMTR